MALSDSSCGTRTAAAVAAEEEEEEETETEETERETRRLAICWKMTKRGKLRKIVREVYLREDISCGVAGCPLCCSSTPAAAPAATAARAAGGWSPSKRVDFLASEDATGGETQGQKLLPQARILLPDATALLQHVSFFEDEPFITSCFILSSVLNQLRSKNLQTYATVRALCSGSAPPVQQQQQEGAEEPPTEKRFFLFNNEFARATYVERRPDETFEEKDLRAVFAATKWLQQHLRAAAAAGLPTARPTTVTLLTTDLHIKEQAQQLGLSALTVKEYAEEMRAIYPHAGEKLAFSVEETEQGETEEGGRASSAAASSARKKSKAPLFTEHLKEAAIAAGLRAGVLVKGKLRMLQDCCWRGVVIAGGKEIRVRGRANLNRAMEGDVVAVEVLPQSRQQEEQQQPQKEKKEGTEEADMRSGTMEAEGGSREENKASEGDGTAEETRRQQQNRDTPRTLGTDLPATTDASKATAAAAAGAAATGAAAAAGVPAAAGEGDGGSDEAQTTGLRKKKKIKKREQGQTERSESEGGAVEIQRAAAESKRSAAAAGETRRHPPEGNGREAAAAATATAATTTATTTATAAPASADDVLFEEGAEERAAEVMVVDEEAAVFPSADLSDSEIEKLEQLEMMEEEKAMEEEEREEDKKSTREGKVVGIIRKGRREFCGTIRPFDNIYRAEAAAARPVAEVVFIPSDRRYPNVLIKTRRLEQLQGKRLVVVVDGWDRFSRYPRGHWTEVLGNFGSAEAEAAVILREHGVISRDFSLASLRCLPPSSWQVKDLPREESSRRLDLRGICVCSIDPPGCKDIDDALSLELLPNGNFRVGVHIADVTYYLREGSALDEEAAERCTTVYLVERRTDMLPGLLTTDLCSLVADQDRLAFSVLWEMTPEGNILSSSIHKTIIHSRAALTYAEAQSIIDDLTDQTELAQNLRRLMSISKALRARRMQQGALQLASPDVQIIRETITEDAAAAAGGGGERGGGAEGAAAAEEERRAGASGAGGRAAGAGKRARPSKGSSGEQRQEGQEFHAEEVVQTEASDITLYQARDTNRLVEDLMLLANTTVAERIVNYFPRASLLRRHPPPKEKQLKALKELLKRTGVDDFNFASSKELSASLSRVAERSPDLDFLVRVLTTRCMEQAVYFSTADAVQQQEQPQEQDASAGFAGSAADAGSSYNAFFRHYGLAAPIYSHFTSPIRRYADVIVHRMLAAALGIAPVPAICSDKQKLSQQCELLNLKHRNAQLAGRSSVQYYVYRYFKSHGEKEAVGVITKVKRNGFLAYIHKYGLEGVVFVKEDDFSFDAKQQQLCSKHGPETLSVFDEVLLRVAASQDNFRPTVNMTLIRKKE